MLHLVRDGRDDDRLHVPFRVSADERRVEKLGIRREVGRHEVYFVGLARSHGMLALRVFFYSVLPHENVVGLAVTGTVVGLAVIGKTDRLRRARRTAQKQDLGTPVGINGKGGSGRGSS